MIVIGYHTGGAYKKEAKLLQASLAAHGIEHRIAHVKGLGEVDWHRGVALKAIVIQHFRKELRGPLLYVDVDAVFHSDPSPYFDTLAGSVDFAAHWFQGPSGGYDRSRNDNQFLSGTLFFNDTHNARLLLAAWVHRNKIMRQVGIWEGCGQASLRDVLDEGLVPDLQVEKLSGRYCYVFDKPWAYPKDEPCIIEHLIASRENRDHSKGKTNAPRQARIAELREQYGVMSE